MIIFLSNTAFLELPMEFREILKHKLVDPVFQQFVALQLEAAKQQIAEIPMEGKTPEVYFQAAKDARLVLQFWTSFQNFIVDWKPKGAPQRKGDF